MKLALSGSRGVFWRTNPRGGQQAKSSRTGVSGVIGGSGGPAGLGTSTETKLAQRVWPSERPNVAVSRNPAPGTRRSKRDI